MFIGHFGAGFAGKKVNSSIPLWVLFMAAQFVDLIWPLFLLLGIEQVQVDPGNTAFTPLNFIYYPFSHGLVSNIIWGVLFGLVYYIIKKDLKASVLLGLLVLSHWILDLLTHRPDLPLLTGDGIKVGLGLWNNVFLTIVVELLIFGVGAYLYFKITEAKNKTGVYSFWGLMIFLLIVYVMNVFGDPPPNAEAIGYVGLSQWLIILWAWWIERNRITKE